MFTTEEKARLLARLSAGPYKVAGDSYANSPGDAARIITFANDFKAAPVVVGRGTAQNLTVWNYYANLLAPSGGDNARPIFHGVKSACAALLCALYQGSNQALADQYGAACRMMLLSQITQPCLAQTPLTFADEYLGTKEGEWLIRIAYTYLLTKDYFTSSEQGQIKTWFVAQGLWLHNRVHNECVKLFPNRLKKDWTTRTYFADPNGVLSYKTKYGSDPIFANRFKGEGQAYQDWSMVPGWDGRIYTHMDSSGVLRNPIPRSATVYNNRRGDLAGAVAYLGEVFDEPTLKLGGDCFFYEYLSFGMFPDGTVSEYERNRDYLGKRSQGIAYGMLIWAKYALVADLAFGKGDDRYYKMQSAAGAHGTECKPGQPPKTWLTLWNRLADFLTWQNPIYCEQVNETGRISHKNASAEVPAEILLSMVNRYYRLDRFAQIINRTHPGCRPLGTALDGGVGAIPVWQGPGGELPGIHFLCSGLHDLELYGRDGLRTVSAESQNLKKSLMVSLEAGGSFSIVSAEQVEGPVKTRLGEMNAQLEFWATDGETVFPPGKYAYKVKLKKPDGSIEERLVETTIAA